MEKASIGTKGILCGYKKIKELNGNLIRLEHGNCGKEFKISKDVIKTSSKIECPYCSERLKIDDNNKVKKGLTQIGLTYRELKDGLYSLYTEGKYVGRLKYCGEQYYNKLSNYSKILERPNTTKDLLVISYKDIDDVKMLVSRYFNYENKESVL